MNKLQTWYSGLQEREQRMVAIGGIAVAFLILVVGILMPLHSAVSTAVSRNETKRDDLEWMQENASEIRAAWRFRLPFRSRLNPNRWCA